MISPKKISKIAYDVGTMVSEDMAIGTLTDREMACLLIGYIWAESDNDVPFKDSKFRERFNGYLRNVDDHQIPINAIILDTKEWNKMYDE